MASADPQAAIRLDSVRFAWPSARRGGGFRLSVEHFSAAPGETVFLAGASGSGKSTLLSLIAGVIAPTSGSIEVAGTRLDALSAAARDRFRAETIGVIFQSFNLLPYASPLDNVLLPLTFAPRRRARAGDAETAARRLMAALGLPREAVEASSAAALSVGQQQRVAVARALIGAPPVIIADEPTSALDAAAQAAFLDLLFEQAGLAKATLLMVSHDRRLAERFDRVVELSEIARTSAEEAAA